MADFAQMIYGTAQNVAQNQGAGLPEALATGTQIGMKQQEMQQNEVNKAAALALKAEELQHKKLELAQKNKELAQAKLGKLYDYVKEARNYDTASARANYLKSALGYRNTMGLDPKAIPDEQIMALGMDENMGRFDALNMEVQAGRMTKDGALKIMNSPELLAKVIPVPDAITKTADLTKAEKEFLDRQSQERQATSKSGQQGIQNTVELRKELNAHPVSKDSFAVNTSYNKLKKALTGPPSAAGDMSAIFGYMKMLDPNSTVREGEQAQAAQATGVPDYVLSAYNRAVTGEKLNAAQRKDFLNQARNIYNTQVTTQAAVNKQYEDIAKQSGINPEQIVAGTNLKPDFGNDKAIKMDNGKEYPESALRALLLKNPNSPLAPEIKAKLGMK